MSLLTCCSSLVLAGFMTVSAPIVESREILPAAKAGFTLEVKGGATPSLLDLLNEYERVSGIHLVLSQDALSAAHARRAGLTQTLVVPQDKVHALVESFIGEAGFCTVLLHPDEPVLLAVKKVDKTVLGANAVTVTAAELSAIETHAALICTTMVDVDALDANELTAAIHGWNDHDFRAVALLRGPFRVALTGKGKDVANRARSLQDLNESARRKVEETKKSNGGSIK